MFGKLFEKRKVIEADDPVFGRLSYDQDIWSHVPKKPAEGFMITVDASESGPTQLQRDFFQKTRSSLSNFERLARNFMRSRVEQGIDVSRLSVYSVEIGNDDKCRRESFVLEMSDQKAIIIHRVSFSGGKPVDYGFDD
jgi:hypothetical protein